MSKKRKASGWSTKHRGSFSSLSSFRLPPCDMQQANWQEFLRNQLIEHRVARLREEIVGEAIASAAEKHRFRSKLFDFASECARTASLRFFNWVLLKLDPHWKCDRAGRAIHLIVDTEPQPPSTDSWIFGNVARTIPQESSFPRPFSSPLPSASVAKPILADNLQHRRRPIHSVNLKLESTDKKSKGKARTSVEALETKKSIETVDEKSKSDSSKRNDCFLPLLDPRPGPRPRPHPHRHALMLRQTVRSNDQPSNLEEEKSIDVVAKVVKTAKKTAKRAGDSSDIDRQQNAANIRRSTKNFKRTETKTQAPEQGSTIQFQGVSDRVEILYAILPEHDEGPTSNAFNAIRTK